MFLVGEFDQEVARAGGLQTGRSTGYCRFATSDGHSVVLRLATSRIGLEQAAHHLRTELPTHRNFDDLLELAAEAWDDVLGVIDQVEGASHDQLVTLYSCLYRMNLYQTIAHESLPDEEGGGVVHASPFLPPTGAGGSDLTSAPVVDGPLVRSSGFWDTYRTTWPALALLYPESTARLADGVLTQFREATWFGTGMVGSCADASFAEMVAQGASDFDVRAAYDVLIQHASVVSPRPGAGRPRMNSSVFLGYTPLAGDREHDESLADFLENCLGDFAIGRLAATLYERTGEEHFRDEHRYFTDRSLRYVNVFDPDVDFFQGRHQDGAFRVQTTDYDPAEWGYDYTETNGWGMAFAVPHDGAGLAALYGGKEALASKLDTFFSTPELSDKPGSYGQIIHEIREAASIGQGQWGFSNQPGFHIPYMYLFAGRPQDTQRLVRHTLARQFAGSAIGQGYPGDEDTGSMSAWFFLSALGLYPLRVGSGEFVIGSPLFSHARVHLGTDAYLTVRARNNAPDNVYVQSLHVNGEPYDKTWLPHELFSEDLDLEFEMGPEPSDWGSGRDAAPPSVTPDGGRPRPMRDLTGPGLGRASIGRPRTHGTDPLDEPEADLLFDNTSDTSVSFQNQADITVTWSMARTSATRVQMYTLTSVSADTAPSAWELHGSRDANEWVLLDSRRDESFHWDRQTRPFRVEEPGEYRYYRWTFHASLKVGHDSSIPMSLAQLELLG
jgi:predicted alpha-1,2-mannosidase